MALAKKKRIWGWMAFDWAQQPYYTLGLTFIFGPYFAAVATDWFTAQGVVDADPAAQSLWGLGQTISGILIALTAPLMGAWADISGRKMPWIWFFSIIYVVCAWCMWFLMPDGRGLFLILAVFNIGIFAAESGLNFTNAILPSLGNDKEVGKISGSASAFGYWGGVVSLFIMLLFFVDTSGTTLLGIKPLFGLDPAQNEGTRIVGPFIAIWYIVFTIPFFLWVRDEGPRGQRPTFGKLMGELKVAIGSVAHSRSLGAFLLGSMFYRDALNALYSFGGVYAKLVLGWPTLWVGVFGIVGAITAAIMTWIGGIYDKRRGPKFVIRFSIISLIIVCTIVVSMSRDHVGPFAVSADSLVPDIIFYICGAVIGGAGGALYSASRSLMVRHTNPSRPAEAFGLFALTGKATAFLAPALISVTTYLTGSNQQGFIPLIILFLVGLYLLRFVNSEGDRAAWSAHS